MCVFTLSWYSSDLPQNLCRNVGNNTNRIRFISRNQISKIYLTGGLRTQPFSLQGDLCHIDQSERPEVHWSPEAQAGCQPAAGWLMSICCTYPMYTDAYWCILKYKVTIVVEIYVRRRLRMICSSLLIFDHTTCPYDMDASLSWVQTSQGMSSRLANDVSNKSGM